MAQYDNVNTISRFLDRHMIFPLLEFLQTMEPAIYPGKDLLKAKLDLLSKTLMIDYAAETYEALHETKNMPEELNKKKKEMISHLTDLESHSKALREVLDNEQLVAELKTLGTFNMQTLKQKFGIDEESLEILYHMGKLRYDSGHYVEAAAILKNFASLSTNPDHVFNALWGQLASEILSEKYEAAIQTVKSLQDAIDSKRSWLLHWSLFPFFSHPSGRSALIELYMNDKYLNALQTTSPHLLRYLVAAILTSPKRRLHLKDLVKEQYVYKDPLTEFLIHLYVEFNFDAAHLKLKECEVVFDSDFFLKLMKDEFIEAARLFMFETYCRINEAIDVSTLSTKLAMDTENAEQWIVNLVRNARLDAKIDAQSSTVVMEPATSNVYLQVLERTQNLTLRTMVLSKKAKDRQLMMGTRRTPSMAY